MPDIKLRTVLAVVVSVLMLAVLYLGWAWNASLNTRVETINVPVGSSLHSVARSLSRQGVLKHPKAFKLLARIRGDGKRIKPGEYSISSDMSPRQLLDKLVLGRVIQYPLRLIEGWNFRQFREAINSADKLVKRTTVMSDSEIMKAIGADESHPEGWFYPDTYYYSSGVSDLNILKQAYIRMKQELDMAWDKRSPDIPVKNKFEALILASIVEKETGQPQERPTIAGVFVNRLNKKMRLQTDPTVIYGMGDRYNGNIRKKDLLRDTPYNTYTRYGLPPTPIAMPGREALNAAVNPAKTRALYFVARGDGSHVFSETFRQHIKAVQEFQVRGRKKDYRSAPVPVNGKHKK